VTTLFEALRAQNHELIKEREAWQTEVAQHRMLLAAITNRHAPCTEQELHNKIGQLEQDINDRDYTIARAREGQAAILQAFEDHKQQCIKVTNRVEGLDVLVKKLTAELGTLNAVLDEKQKAIDDLSTEVSELTEAASYLIDASRIRGFHDTPDLNVIKRASSELRKAL